MWFERKTHKATQGTCGGAHLSHLPTVPRSEPTPLTASSEDQHSTSTSPKTGGPETTSISTTHTYRGGRVPPGPETESRSALDPEAQVASSSLHSADWRKDLPLSPPPLDSRPWQPWDSQTDSAPRLRFHPLSPDDSRHGLSFLTQVARGGRNGTRTPRNVHLLPGGAPTAVCSSLTRCVTQARGRAGWPRPRLSGEG